MGDETDVREAIRRAGGRPERAGVIGRLAEGEQGTTAERVAAVRELEPSLFDGPNELLRRATGRLGTEPRSTSTGGSDFNDRLRAGFGHAPAASAPEVDPDAPPIWGDAETGVRDSGPMRVKSSTSVMSDAIRRTSRTVRGEGSVSRKVRDLEWEEEER